MEIAAIILSVISLVCSLALLVIFLAKNVFSTHKIQFQPIDPLRDMTEPGQVGNNLFDSFRELGEPVDSEELAELERLRTRKIK